MEKRIYSFSGDIQNNSSISEGRNIRIIQPDEKSSRGEFEEIRSHLRVALGLKYIDKKVFERLDKEYEGLSKGISSFIRTLKQS